jgi:DNA-binding response OmpR family regulator
MLLRALVCDDDTPIRNMVRDMLEERGVEVIEAKDGQEALTAFMKEEIDLVVTDFLMPKVDGLQMIRNIRLSGERGQIPVVLMSAISQNQIAANQEEMGPDYYINKPFRPRKIAKLLDKVLRRIRAGTPPGGTFE